jgi:hypothetical protein
VTVVLYKARKVVANYAFKKGQMTDKDVEKVLADLPRILPEKSRRNRCHSRPVPSACEGLPRAGAWGRYVANLLRLLRKDAGQVLEDRFHVRAL